jgi:hypothetical protein
MKKLFMAVAAAICLTAGVAPMAQAYTTGFPHTTNHSGPYDNTGNGPAQNYGGGDN